MHSNALDQYVADILDPKLNVDHGRGQGSDFSMPDLGPIYESSDDLWSTSSESSLHDLKTLSDSSSDESSDYDIDIRPYMPLRLSMLAPKFDGNAESLERFFSDVEMMCSKCDTEEYSIAEWALEYIEKFDDYNLWRLHAADYLNNWEWFKDRIRDLYPDSREPAYTICDLYNFVEGKRVFNSIGDIADYYRKFLLITQTLRENGQLMKLDERKLLDMFWRGLASDTEFAKQFIKYKLTARGPTPRQSAIEMVFKDACDAWKAKDK